MTATWPPGVPFTPLESGWQEKMANNTVRTQNAVGPVQVRRRTTAGVKQVAAQFSFTAAQLATVEGFFTTTLKDGSLKFDATHPRTGAVVIFRFVEPLTSEPSGPVRWRVSMSLEILPQ